RERVRELGLSDEYIQTDRGHPTGTVRVTLDANKVPTYTITENVAWDHLRLVDQLSERVVNSRAICFGTLAQRSGETRGTIRRLKSYAWDQESPEPILVLDCNLRQAVLDRQLILDSLDFGCWVKLNDEELNCLAGLIPLS